MSQDNTTVPASMTTLRCKICGTPWTRDNQGELATASIAEGEATCELIPAGACPICSGWGTGGPPHYAEVHWTAADVLKVAAENGVRMTAVQAEEFLEEIEGCVEDTMTEAGLALIADLLPSEDKA